MCFKYVSKLSFECREQGQQCAIYFFFFEQNVIIFDCGHMEIICIEIHFECFQNR